MDYNTLRRFRAYLEELSEIIQRKKEIPIELIHDVQIATENHIPEHITRELRLLPHEPWRISVLTALANVPNFSDLRHAILSDEDLMRQQSTDLSNSKKAVWGKVFGQLVVSWRKANEEAGVTSKLLQSFEKTYAHYVDEIESSNAEINQQSEPVADTERVLYNTKDGSLISNSENNSFLLRKEPEIREDCRRCYQRIRNAEEEIEQAIGLLGNVGIEELQNGGHDGVKEIVSAAWGQISKAHRRLRKLRGEANELLRIAIDSVLKLQAEDIIEEIDREKETVNRRQQQLNSMGFAFPNVEAKKRGTTTAQNHLDSDDSEEDEDDWEDAVEIQPEPKADQALEVEEDEDDLPDIENWAAVLHGKESKQMNEVLLNKLEGKVAETGTASSSHEAKQFLQKIEKKQKELAKAKMKDKPGKGTGTVKDRLKKVLGMKKKKKKKSLLD